MDKQHPPIGTYPPDEAAGALHAIPWQPPQPPEDKPVKKVGTVTVAIGLIAIGVLMIARLVFPGLNYAFIARLSPLLLVAYGAEILVASTMFRDRQIKYDLVGLMVSVILIGVSLTAAVLPEAISNERTSSAAQRRMRDELNAISFEELQAADIDVAELDWYLEPADYNKWTENTALGDIDLAADYLQVRIRFVDTFTTEDEFASACRKALDAMGVYAQNADYAIFYSFNYDQDNRIREIGTPRFGLWLENNYQVNFTTEQIAAQVEDYYWAGNHGWVPLDDYEYILNSPYEFFGEEYGDPYVDVDMDEPDDYDEPDYDDFDEPEYDDFDEDPYNEDGLDAA